MQYKKMFNPPNHIKILSDNNEIQLIKTMPKNKNQKEETYIYKFIKSLSKMDVECSFTELELKKCLNNTFKVIE